MHLSLFIFFAILSSFACIQTTEGAAAKKDSVADSPSESKDSPTNNEDEDADTMEDDDSAEEPAEKPQSRKHQESRNNKENEDAPEDTDADESTSSSESSNDGQQQQVSGNSNNGRKVKDSAREKLEKFVGRFVIDYLISRLRAAKKQLVASLLSPNENQEDK